MKENACVAVVLGYTNSFENSQFVISRGNYCPDIYSRPVTLLRVRDRRNSWYARRYQLADREFLPWRYNENHRRISRHKVMGDPEDNRKEAARHSAHSACNCPYRRNQSPGEQLGLRRGRRWSRIPISLAISSGEGFATSARSCWMSCRPGHRQRRRTSGPNLSVSVCISRNHLFFCRIFVAEV